MSPSEQKPSNRLPAAAVVGASILALLATRPAFAPDFGFLHGPTRLFAWLVYATLLTAALPSIAYRFAFRRRLAEAGIGFGEARRDALPIALCVLLALVAALALSRLPAVRAHYPAHAFVRDAPILWIPSTLLFAAYGLAQEALFRGYLLISLADTLGRRALFLQMALYTLAHAGKPPVEMALSIPAGLVFGLAALRTRSVLPGYGVHFALSTGVNFFCVYG